MRNMLLSLVAAGTLAAALATPAEASGGCGPYRHRAPYGRCYPNGYWGGPGYAFAPRPYFYGPRFAYGYGYGWRRPYYGWRHY